MVLAIICRLPSTNFVKLNFVLRAKYNLCVCLTLTVVLSVYFSSCLVILNKIRTRCKELNTFLGVYKTSILCLVGALFTEEVLDYEANPELEIGVRAMDGMTGHTATVRVRVVVTDVNDLVPTFPQSSYHLTVAENTAAGHLVAVLRAQDNETGLCARLYLHALLSNY